MAAVSLASTDELAQNVLTNVLISGGIVLVMSVEDVDSELVVRTSYRVSVGVGVHAIHRVPGTLFPSATEARGPEDGGREGRAVSGLSSPMPPDVSRYITKWDAPRRGYELCSSRPSWLL